MDEVFPFLGGIALGLAYIGRPRTTMLITVLALLACCIAITASAISGELSVSWWYTGLDLVEVLAAALITALLLGPVRRRIANRTS